VSTPSRDALLDLWRRGYDAGEENARRNSAGDLALGTAARRQAETDRLLTQAIAVLAAAMLSPAEMAWADARRARKAAA
jgi:hypothetical protein